MAYRLIAWLAPSHYLNQCWFTINETIWHQLQANFKDNSKLFIEKNAFGNVVCKMLVTLVPLIMHYGPRMVKLCLHVSRVQGANRKQDVLVKETPERMYDTLFPRQPDVL